jgi:hypothetical protein
MSSHLAIKKQGNDHPVSLWLTPLQRRGIAENDKEKMKKVSCPID